MARSNAMSDDGLYTPEHDKNDPSAVKVWADMQLSSIKKNAVWCNPCSTWFKKKDDIEGLRKHCSKVHYTAGAKTYSRRQTNPNNTTTNTPQTATPKPKKRLPSAILPNVAKKLRVELDTDADAKMQAPSTPAPAKANAIANARVATPKTAPPKAPGSKHTPPSGMKYAIAPPVPPMATKKTSAIALPISKKTVPPPIAPVRPQNPITIQASTAATKLSAIAPPISRKNAPPATTKPSAIAPPIARKAVPSAIAPPKKKPTPSVAAAAASPAVSSATVEQRKTASAQQIRQIGQIRPQPTRKAAPPPFAPPRKSTNVPPKKTVVAPPKNTATRTQAAQPTPAATSTALNPMQDSNQNQPTPISTTKSVSSPLSKTTTKPATTSAPKSQCKSKMGIAKPTSAQSPSPSQPAVREKPPVTPAEFKAMNARHLVKQRRWKYVEPLSKVREIAERAQANLFASTQIYFYEASFILPQTDVEGTTVMRGAVGDSLKEPVGGSESAGREKLRLLSWAHSQVFRAEMAQLGYRFVNIKVKRYEKKDKDNNVKLPVLEEWLVIRALKKSSKKRMKKDESAVAGKKKAKVENENENIFNGGNKSVDNAMDAQQNGVNEEMKASSQALMDTTAPAAKHTAQAEPTSKSPAAPSSQTRQPRNTPPTAPVPSLSNEEKNAKKGSLPDFIDLTI